MKCIIVDDEPLAREGLEGYVSQLDFLELQGSYDSAIKANSALQKENIDLMLLDINMPVMSGIEFLRELAQPPQVIITTAYPGFALEGYALNVTDYLLKPVSFPRFMQAVNKAYDIFKLKKCDSQDFIFIKCDNRFEKIAFSNIIYIEGALNYVTFHTAAGRFITYLTLKKVEEQLPPAQFLRVHKSFIVSIPMVTAIEGNELIIGKSKIPISRERKDEVMMRLLKNNILRRE